LCVLEQGTERDTATFEWLEKNKEGKTNGSLIGRPKKALFAVFWTGKFGK